MKKTIIRSTFYLIILSIIAKAMSFIVRIILARSLSAEAMNYYSLAMPTMVIMITLAQMGIPSALSKVIAQQKNHRNSLKAAIFISIVNNLILTIFFLIFIPLLSHFILKQSNMVSVGMAIIPLIPMVTLSGILKGYLLGIQHHIAATSSQIFEELSRIIFLFVMFTLYPTMTTIQMAVLAMFSITVGEICSSLYMLFIIFRNRRLPNIWRHPFKDLKRNHFDDVLQVSIPMTGSRLIGSITYFLEPIVMVIGLSTFNADIMVNAYGQLNGYVLPIITMPSFVTITLSNMLLPSFTYHYTRGNDRHAKKLFNIILGCCFMIGIACSFICFTYSEELLILFYNNSKGAELLKSLAWPFALYALQPALSSMLHALSQSRKAMSDTLIGSIVRILCVALLTSKIFALSLPLAMTLGMMVTTILHAINIAIALRKESY